MVNVSLLDAILREQDDPGASTTRKIRDIYNIRSGENAIIQHSDEDKEFQTILLKALESLPLIDSDNEEDKPISYTVKLKDSDESITPTVKRRSIIKLPKETKKESESDEASSDSEKISTVSSIALTKPFSPLFLNNMKKFGVSSDWLSKRSNSVRQTAYSRSSVKSNTNKLDEMIKSASAKPIRSSRKLSFIENATTTPTKIEIDKENSDPLTETNEKKEEKEEEEEEEEKEKETTKTSPVPSPYDLSSEIDEDKADDSCSPRSKAFSLRIPRVDLPAEDPNRTSKRSKLSSSPSSSNDESKQKTKPKKNRRSKKKSTATTTSPTITDASKKVSEEKETDEQETTNIDEKKPEKKEQGQARIEQLKKLLRISGIRLMIKKTELEELPSNKARINYLKSLFNAAGFTSNLSIKECQKFRKKRDEEKELMEIQANAVDVIGHVKGGRTLRGQGRNSNVPDITLKRKRILSTDIEDNNDNNNSSDDEKPVIKKRRTLPMEASPEVSEDE